MIHLVRAELFLAIANGVSYTEAARSVKHRSGDKDLTRVKNGKKNSDMVHSDSTSRQNPYQSQALNCS